MKIRTVGAELLHADGQTDMTNLIVTFHNFANAPKNAYRLQSSRIQTENVIIVSHVHIFQLLCQTQHILTPSRCNQNIINVKIKQK
jgi:hypothetical protein